MNDDQQLDKILDQALSEYRDAEPLAGLEDRVLQRLRLQPVARRNTSWKWAGIAACAATLAFAAWLGLRGNGPQGPVALPQTQASNADIRPLAKPAAQTPRTVTNKRVPLPQITLPTQIARSAVAPMRVAQLDDNERASHHESAPLTGEERQLLALAQTHPDVVRAIAQEDQPIAITRLTIQPLPSEANQNGDN
jgi:hypothetical protein